MNVLCRLENNETDFAKFNCMHLVDMVCTDFFLKFI